MNPLAPWIVAAGRSVSQATARMLGSEEAALAEFGFLAEYLGDDSEGEQPSPHATPNGESPLEGSPLGRLVTAAALDTSAWRLLVVLGLIDEDARFGVLFEALQTSPGQHRPTLGLLQRWWPEARGPLRTLITRGLVRVQNPDAPRSETVLEVPAPLWDILCGETTVPRWATWQPAQTLTPLETLRLPGAVHDRVCRLPDGDLAVVVRGPRNNGRGSLLGGLARRRNQGTLTVVLPADDPRLLMVGPMASALGALPVLRFEPGPGQTITLDFPAAYRGAVGVVLPQHGGLDGELARRAVALRVPMPELRLREALWEVALPGSDAATLARTFRLTTGNIQRAAVHALALTIPSGDTKQSNPDDTRAGAPNTARPTVPSLEDVREAARSLHREALDQLATPLPAAGGWDDLALSGEPLAELRELQRRCQHREKLVRQVGPALQSLGPGVRALFAGPSGTGKTLAARTLAAELKMDLYRLDLGAVVNKYIGETEKNLERVFSRAEELDVVLLLDEGDALMARRTAVTSANDRYANLETNFLLQRLESFGGILLVTTNTFDRIDPAFARRMDVIVEFVLPEPPEREKIWRRHLPPNAELGATFRDVVDLCRLTGGQVRNAAIHAALLGLEAGRPPGPAEILAAVEREYRKAGGSCPVTAG